MFPLTVEHQTAHGNPILEIRPRGIENSQTFAIQVNEYANKITCTVVMDRFAGPIVRAIESAVTGEMSRWESILTLAAKKNIATSILVNGMYLELDKVDSVREWVSLELEARVGVRSNSANPEFGIVGPTSMLIALLTDALDVQFEQDDRDNLEVSGELEGFVSQVRATVYERNPANRYMCIEFYGPECWICDLDFKEFYGPLGEGFIEVHHRTPISTLIGPTAIDPVRDLIPLCSNCHSMVHREKPPIRPAVLRASLGKPTKFIAGD
jgi:5-methylcytosine-specific restriction protein A